MTIEIELFIISCQLAAIAVLLFVIICYMKKR